MKQYHNLTDIEKGWITEYKSWCKAGREDCELIPIALEMAEQYAGYLKSHGLKVWNY